MHQTSSSLPSSFSCRIWRLRASWQSLNPPALNMIGYCMSCKGKRLPWTCSHFSRCGWIGLAARYRHLAFKSPVTLERWFGGRLLISKTTTVQQLLACVSCQPDSSKMGEAKPCSRYVFPFANPSRKTSLEAGVFLMLLPSQFYQGNLYCRL